LIGFIIICELLSYFFELFIYIFSVLTLPQIILMTPESDYNSKLAIQVLSNFKEEEIVECYKKLAEEGYTQTTRAIGISRGYQFSSKYASLL
jgi:hypothetical protein